MRRQNKPSRRSQLGLVYVGRGRALMGGRTTLAKIISALFPAGEEGAIYETDPITSMYQESTGATVAVVGQPVGQTQDKRLRLATGAEKVSNGAFDGVADGTDVITLPGWSAYGTPTSRDIQSNRLHIVQNAVNQGAQLDASMVAGKWYRLSFNYSGDGVCGLFNSDVGGVGGTGDISRTFLATANNLFYFRVNGNTAGTGYFDNISIKEVLGNHSLQATSAARSVLTAYGAYNGEMFDGFDDSKTAVAGAGGTTGFFWCGAVRVLTVGAVQTLWSDTGTNTGYRVRLNASNQLELAAGNNVAYTTANTVPTVSVNTNYVLTGWHDGANLNAQINLGAVGQAAFVTATAGTAGFTRAKDNGAASNFSNHAIFCEIYKKNANVSAQHRLMVQKYVATKAGISL